MQLPKELQRVRCDRPPQMSVSLNEVQLPKELQRSA